MKTIVRLLPLLLLFACVTPRVSTPDERAMAEAAIATAETGILVAQAAGKLQPGDFQMLMQAVVDLRTAIAASEHTPGNWLALYQRALNFAAQWVVARQG